MDFDGYSIALLLHHPQAPDLAEEEEARLQDAHMSFPADLHEVRHLLVAGPVLGAPDRELSGLSILGVSAEQARELSVQDPAVRAGKTGSRHLTGCPVRPDDVHPRPAPALNGRGQRLTLANRQRILATCGHLRRSSRMPATIQRRPCGRVHSAR